MPSPQKSKVDHGQFSFPASFSKEKLVVPSTGESVPRKQVINSLREFAAKIRVARPAAPDISHREQAAS